MIVLGKVQQVEVVNITLNGVEFKNIPLMNTMGALKQYGLDEQNYIICTYAEEHNQNANSVFSSFFGDLFRNNKNMASTSSVVVIYALGKYAIQAKNIKTQEAKLNEHIRCMELENHDEYDEYMLGIVNGIAFAKACLKGEDIPSYTKAPETWRKDKIALPSSIIPEMSETRKGGKCGLPTR